MNEDLVRAIKTRNAVLFVGAGASMGLGLPSWQQLVDHIARDLNYDPQIISASNASFMTMAEYYTLTKGPIGPLRSWMDKEWNVQEEALRKSTLHNAIVDLNFRKIYTTNYDRNIERTFELRGVPYHKITDVRHFGEPGDKTEIIKFHGDFDDDSSIVLTESDYYRRLEFESPLDLKLRADILGRTVLFIGYSLSDINIRLLFYKLSRLWKESGHEKDRPRSFILLFKPDAVQETVLRNWGIEPIVMDVDNPSDTVDAFLKDLLKQVEGA